MNIQTVSGSCIIKNNKILLLKQSSEETDGLPDAWGPPVGHGEENEKLIDTAIREAREECNLEVKPIGIVESGLYRTQKGNIYLIVLYICKANNLSKLKIDNQEIVDYKWVSLDELRSDKIKLRHPILLPILIKALSEKPLPLSVFKDQDI